MAQSSNNAVGVDNTFRRKFDKEEYLERARKREQEEEEGGRHKSKSKGPPVQRKPLKHRDYEVDLESRLGKTQVVTPIAPLSQQAGYYCSVCECVVKDSANYLDHINGKKQKQPQESGPTPPLELAIETTFVTSASSSDSQRPSSKDGIFWTYSAKTHYPTSPP
ncbi:zinc finger matrin-type protein 2 [Vitis riparia]|uniref:zinc finger matrin-type protein 2 n=1 Tax=Vitis riparia TaxID=96939 RepID=UPI00155AB299|nr:zinc finger matrin-type protein 2 [Vitis riparia]